MITNLFEDNTINVIHHKNKSVLHEKEAPAETQKTRTEEKTSVVDDLFNKISEEYSRPFADLPQSVKSDLESSYKELNLSETKEDLRLAVENIKDTIIKVINLAFNKRTEIFKKIINSEEFENKKKELGETASYRTELNAFKSTNAYKQIQSAITQSFDVLKTIDFNDLKINTSLLDKSKDYISSLVNTQLNDKNKINETNTSFEEFLLSINPEKKSKPKTNIKENDLISGKMPQLLKTIINKCWPRLNDVDKTVLNYYEQEQPYPGYVATDNLISKNISLQMTPEGIVCLCGMAMDKYFPAGEDKNDEDDIVLELQKFTYKGGKSTATIHYGQPKDKRKDSQFFELVVDPAVMVGKEKGRAELIIRTFDDEDDTKFVTKRSKRVSVYDTLKLLFTDEDGSRGKRRSRY